MGSLFATEVVGGMAMEDGVMNYQKLFSIPMYMALACLAALLVFYPNKKPDAAIA